MIEFVNAIFFMAVTVPVWGFVTAAFILAALGLGFLLGLLKLGMGLFAIINTIFQFVETSTPFDETLGRVFLSLITEVFATLARMWNWGVSVPDWMWNFARYEHPWWAFIIAIVMLFLIPKWLE